jgi:hypothetical protein
MEASYSRDLILLKIQAQRWNPYKQVLGATNLREGGAQGSYV